MTKASIAIVGAGIGGLASGIALLERGFAVRVYEQTPEMSEVGAGLQLSANATHVLSRLGVLNEFKDIGVSPKQADFKHFLSGESLFKAPLGWIHQLAFRSPYIHVHRADVQNILLKKLRKLDSRALQLGRELDGISQDQSNVYLKFTDGSRECADIVLGADGIKSKLRSLLFVESEAQWTGNVAWRAVVPAQNLPNDFLPRQATVFVGPKRHVVMYYLRGMRWLNVVAVQEADQPSGQSWIQKTSWEEIKEAYDGWHPCVQAAIKAMPRDEVYRWDLYSRPKLDSWINGRVLLLGDAAHATLPFVAQGAAMALEDALVVARCLDHFPIVHEAFNAYQTLRKERTEKIQRQSEENATLYHHDASSLAQAFKSAMQDASNYKTMFNIYRYRAGDIKLPKQP